MLGRTRSGSDWVRVDMGLCRVGTSLVDIELGRDRHALKKSISPVIDDKHGFGSLILTLKTSPLNYQMEARQAGK